MQRTARPPAPFANRCSTSTFDTSITRMKVGLGCIGKGGSSGHWPAKWSFKRDWLRTTRRMPFAAFPWMICAVFVALMNSAATFKERPNFFAMRICTTLFHLSLYRRVVKHAFPRSMGTLAAHFCAAFDLTARHVVYQNCMA